MQYNFQAGVYLVSSNFWVGSTYQSNIHMHDKIQNIQAENCLKSITMPLPTFLLSTGHPGTISPSLSQVIYIVQIWCSFSPCRLWSWVSIGTLYGLPLRSPIHNNFQWTVISFIRLDHMDQPFLPMSIIEPWLTITPLLFTCVLFWSTFCRSWPLQTYQAAAVLALFLHSHLAITNRPLSKLPKFVHLLILFCFQQFNFGDKICVLSSFLT